MFGKGKKQFIARTEVFEKSLRFVRTCAGERVFLSVLGREDICTQNADALDSLFVDVFYELTKGYVNVCYARREPFGQEYADNLAWYLRGCGHPDCVIIEGGNATENNGQTVAILKSMYKDILVNFDVGNAESCSLHICCYSGEIPQRARESFADMLDFLRSYPPVLSVKPIDGCSHAMTAEFDPKNIDEAEIMHLLREILRQYNLMLEA